MLRPALLCWFAAALGAVDQPFDLGHFLMSARSALDREAAGTWRTIQWQRDAATALATATRTGKPILVFVYITVDAYLPGESGTQVCLGGRATRGAVLSDAAVIAALRDHFVCLHINCKTGGFPEVLPGLNLCREAYRRYADPEAGFSTSCVLTPDGCHLLGTSGIGSIPTYRSSACYDPVKYRRFLEESSERGQRWKRSNSAGRKSISGEVLLAAIAASSGQDGPR